MMRLERSFIERFAAVTFLMIFFLGSPVWAGEAPSGERKEAAPLTPLTPSQNKFVTASNLNIAPQNQPAGLSTQASVIGTAMAPMPKMEMVAKNQLTTNQPMLQRDGGPKVNLPNQGNLPNKSDFFFGGAQPMPAIQHGSSHATSGSQDKKTPDGVPSWVKMKGQKGQASTMTVADFSKEAKIKKLFELRASRLENMTKGQNFGATSGWSEVAGRKGIPFQEVGAAKQSIEHGAGKNLVSEQSELSAGGSSGDGKKRTNEEKIRGWFGKGQSGEKQSGEKKSVSQVLKEDDLRTWKETVAKHERRLRGGDKPQGSAVERAWKWLEHHVGGDAKFKQPTSPGGVGVRGTPTPDSVDTGTLPAMLKNRIKETKKTSEQIQTERRRKVTLPSENKRQIEKVHVKVTGKDIRKKRTDGLTNPVEGRDGSATPTPPSIKGNDGYVVTPVGVRPGKKRGGGGDPSPVGQ